jgi:hypothetical protein
MKKSLSIVLIAVLAFGIGIAYASPMLIPNIELYPQVIEGPKAVFNVDVVYAKFNTTEYQTTNPFYNEQGQIDHYETYSGTNVNSYVVLNITNTADTPATLYDLKFAGAQNVTVKDSIVGGSIYDDGFRATNPLGSYKIFGGVVNGVYLDGEWVNVTWVPTLYIPDTSGSISEIGFPYSLGIISAASWHQGIISGPLTPENVAAFTEDHTLNATIPKAPDNASQTGTWFEGVPISEYYSPSGTPLITEMYINGAWVDVTGRVTSDNPQPLITTSNTLVTAGLSLGAQPYQNLNASAGQVTFFPTWGDWGTGIALPWLPWDWNKQGFNNTFAPHESRLMLINITLAPNSLVALESGKIALYASASNYVINEPTNGTYLNTASTTTTIKQVTLQPTPDGYLYNTILSDNQTFQQGNSKLEVTVAQRTEP